MSLYIHEYQDVFDTNRLDQILALMQSQRPDINSDFVIQKKDIPEEWQDHFDHVEKTSLELVKEYLKKTYSQLPMDALSLNHIGFKTDPEGAFTQLHYDWEMNKIGDDILMKPMVALVYLSDVEEGGGCFFPLEKITIEPKKGKVAIFPCNFSFPHVTHPVLKGTKELMRLTFRMDMNYYQSETIEF